MKQAVEACFDVVTPCSNESFLYPIGHIVPIRRMPVRGGNRGSPESVPGVDAVGPSAQTRVPALVGRSSALEARATHDRPPARLSGPKPPDVLWLVPLWRLGGDVRPVPSRAAPAGAMDLPGRVAGLCAAPGVPDRQRYTPRSALGAEKVPRRERARRAGAPPSPRWESALRFPNSQ